MQDNTINNIQANIIRQLFRHDELRFAETNVGKVSSDQFSYHLRQLVKKGLIEKTKDNLYRLTVVGRTRAIMMYPTGNRFIEQGFIATKILLSKVEDGKTYYLMQRRDYVPYQGSIGLPGDKIIFGEDICEAAKRIMKEETGLTCTVQLHGLIHLKDRYGTKIVQDKYFFVLRATDPEGRLLPRSMKGEFMWMTYEEIETSDHLAPHGLDILKIATSKSFQFQESTVSVTDY